MNMIDVLYIIYENKTVKPVEIVLSRGQETRENDNGGESNQGTLQAYMKMSQRTPYPHTTINIDNFF
jgi:hypothetical protein